MPKNWYHAHTDARTCAHTETEAHWLTHKSATPVLDQIKSLSANVAELDKQLVPPPSHEERVQVHEGLCKHACARACVCVFVFVCG